MRIAGHFGAVVMAASIGACSIAGHTEDSASVIQTSSTGTPTAVPPAADTTYASPSSPANTIAITSANRAPGASSRRRSRNGRWWNFNRYPGPIPTPEEWKPPEGPVRIALQAGHWKAHEAPPELEGLKDNGTRWGSMSEAEVNLAIVRATEALLKEKGYLVDILPAVVPPDYRAHLFLSIHADGAASTTATGFRVSAPRRDATGRGGGFASLLETSYGRATGLRLIPDPTRRMEMYYAFNFRRYEHALHPMTIAAILETGYLTSASDRRIIVDDPERVARGIVDAIVAFPETPPPKG